MRRLIAIAALILAPGLAMADDEVPAEVVAQITAMLAEMQCEMDPSDIEAEDDGGYELDDVFCVDGQYDMKLDADLQITERRKE
ncbi:MAG TPA: PepSY domain-containing protein [Rhodovulum sp.]|nr:PepSY domain-containing protein [Rhodovulum sp.]HDR28048.1 PepSY domain-containing protein [Rhodovulum sp.]